MQKFGHYIFFSLTLIWLGLGLFYQVLVRPDYQRFSWRQFLHPAFFLAAISALQYQPQALGQPSPANPAGITLSCDNFCNFIIKDKIIPARVEIDAAGRLKDLTLQFFDPNSGLIGYQDKSQEPIFYVINDQSELLQVVRLSLNHRSPLRFQNYFSNSRQILFTSDSGESFLYSADHPSLHLL